MDKITLDEFCKKLSLTDKRVELIGGFYHRMRFEKRVAKASFDQFQDHYNKFCNAPA
jgi:hypothetical protein